MAGEVAVQAIGVRRGGGPDRDDAGRRETQRREIGPWHCHVDEAVVPAAEDRGAGVDHAPVLGERVGHDQLVGRIGWAVGNRRGGVAVKTDGPGRAIDGDQDLVVRRIAVGRKLEPPGEPGEAVALRRGCVEAHPEVEELRIYRAESGRAIDGPDDVAIIDRAALIAVPVDHDAALAVKRRERRREGLAARRSPGQRPERQHDSGNRSAHGEPPGRQFAITNSTRRFFARPARVMLGAIGLDSP